MQRSIILVTATRILQPILLLLSLFILFRGHNEPGGGFIGGLVAASGAALYAFASNQGIGGNKREEEALMVRPRLLIATGLLLALGSALVPPLLSVLPGIDATFMQGIWSDVTLPVVGKPGTPLLFDIGVYLLVIGVVLIITNTLFEQD